MKLSAAPSSEFLGWSRLQREPICAVLALQVKHLPAGKLITVPPLTSLFVLSGCFVALSVVAVLIPGFGQVSGLN